MAGGLGNDTYIVDTLDWTALSKLLGGGTDTVKTADYLHPCLQHRKSKTSHLRARLLSTAQATPLNNVIVGNSAINILSGAVGTDTLTGGLGNDTFVFSSSEPQQHCKRH